MSRIDLVIDDTEVRSNVVLVRPWHRNRGYRHRVNKKWAKKVVTRPLLQDGEVVRIGLTVWLMNSATHRTIQSVLQGTSLDDYVRACAKLGIRYATKFPEGYQQYAQRDAGYASEVFRQAAPRSATHTVVVSELGHGQGKVNLNVWEPLLIRRIILEHGIPPFRSRW